METLERDDAATVRALRAGDEDTFRRLVREWNAPLLRVAQIYVPSRAAAVRELLRRGLAAEGFLTARPGAKSQDFGVISSNGNGEGIDPAGG